MLSKPLLALTGTFILAGMASPQTTVEGSTPAHRSQTDISGGLVMIYVGGLLPAGTAPEAFRFLFDETTAGNTSGFITPLLFRYTPSETAPIFTVAAIGKGAEVSLGSSPQTIPFTIVEGVRLTSNDLYTFGFVNSIVDASGAPIVSSRGAVDFDTPADSGDGVGGAGTTNQWAVSNSYSPPAKVGIGTTFSATARTGVDYTFFPTYRTYSAEAIGVIPPNRGLTLNGSATLLTGQNGNAVIRLTPASTGQAGSAFTTSSVPFDAGYTFSTYFQFQMTDPGFQASDGMTFTIQTEGPTAVGGNGGGLGYVGIQPSVAVEFDDWDNGGADINDNHVAILTNGLFNDQDSQTPYGVTACQPPNGTFGCMNNGDVWSVWIDYDGANLTVALADNSTTRPANLISYPIDLASILGLKPAYVGFTGGTGEGYENHYVLNWLFY